MLYDLKVTQHSQKYEGQSHLQTLLVDKGRLCKKKKIKGKEPFWQEILNFMKVIFLGAPTLF